MKTVAVIAARMGSTRLPGKSLMPILDVPMLERMVDRVRRSKRIDDIVIATTSRESDNPLVAWAEKYGVHIFRGSEEDVLGRIAAAVAASGAKIAVELLGDNPLVHADLIDDVLAYYHANAYDYVVSVTNEHKDADPGLARFPIGIRVEVLSQATLARCAQLATDPYHRENALSYIYHHPDTFSIGYFEAAGKWDGLNRPELNFAVNYQENFDLIEQLFRLCYPKNPEFDLFEVIRACDERPEFLDWMGVPAALR